MNKGDIKKTATAVLTGNEIVSSKTDPDFYGSLEILDNPDALLRKMGKVDEVYAAIAADAHIVGETRSSRAGLLKFETRLTAGGDAPADKKALELCQQILDNEPAPNMIWADVFWNISQSQYYGFVVHEIVWEYVDGYVLPVKLLDRKSKRFAFSHDGTLLARMKGKDKPEPIDDKRVLLSRHQPSASNPYGKALFSSCFWPFTFKHAGYRSYSKFINKYGLPWAIGKYAQGTTETQRNELVEALMQMVEDAVAAIPEGSSVELVESKGSKGSPQKEFITLCNTEMSKALTSQTMATEQSANGSRAAAQTAREREESVDTSQRTIVESAMNKLFKLVTEINVAGAKPPKFAFFEKDKAPTEWVEALSKASEFMPVSAKFAQEMTGIKLADGLKDQLKPMSAEFATATLVPHAYHDAQARQTQQIKKLLDESTDMADFQKKLDAFKFSDDVAQAMHLSMTDSLIKGRSNV